MIVQYSDHKEEKYMLIYCTDCRKRISDDVQTCPNCGCNIKARKEEGYVFEKSVLPHYNAMGIASAAMTLGLPFLFVLLLAMTLSNSVLGIVLMFLFSGGKVALGVIPLIKDKSAYKWPSIVGIIIGSFLFVFMLLGFLLVGILG